MTTFASTTHTVTHDHTRLRKGNPGVLDHGPTSRTRLLDELDVPKHEAKL